MVSQRIPTRRPPQPGPRGADALRGEPRAARVQRSGPYETSAPAFAEEPYFAAVHWHGPRGRGPPGSLSRPGRPSPTFRRRTLRPRSRPSAHQRAVEVCVHPLAVPRPRVDPSLGGSAIWGAYDTRARMTHTVLGALRHQRAVSEQRVLPRRGLQHLGRMRTNPRGPVLGRGRHGVRLRRTELHQRVLGDLRGRSGRQPRGVPSAEAEPPKRPVPVRSGLRGCSGMESLRSPHDAVGCLLGGRPPSHPLHGPSPHG